MKRMALQLITFITLVLLVVTFKPDQKLEHTNVIPDFSQPAIQVTSNSKLLDEIKEKSKLFEEPPQNAKLDKVWKKTPGRNGLKVNVEKSFEKMKNLGKFDKSKLVFDEVAPEITFEDLPPSPVYRGHPEKNMVALLINVAWGEENLPTILSILKEHRVKANFFIEGKWASKQTKLVKMIKEEGHVIGNHAYNHPDMSKMNKEQSRQQIKKANDIITAITGDTPKWFAPPSGSFNEQVVTTAANLGVETVLWTVDTIDWQKPSTTVLVNRVKNKIHPGATILMHPTKVVAQSLDQLLLHIEQEGYKIGTLDKLMSEKR